MSTYFGVLAEWARMDLVREFFEPQLLGWFPHIASAARPVPRTGTHQSSSPQSDIDRPHDEMEERLETSGDCMDDYRHVDNGAWTMLHLEMRMTGPTLIRK